MGRGSWPPAAPPPTSAAYPALSLVGVDVGGLRLGEAWLPWGSRPPPLRLCLWEVNPHSPPNTNQTPPSWGSWCPCGGGSRGVGSVLCPEERGGGWRGQLAGLLGGAGLWEERGLSELACTPCSLPALPPVPCPSPFWGALELTACVTHLAQEFENAEGEEYPADFSAQGSPAAAAQNGPDVYVLPLTEVSLPMAKQPGRSGE